MLPSVCRSDSGTMCRRVLSRYTTRQTFLAYRLSERALSAKALLAAPRGILISSNATSTKGRGRQYRDSE